MLSIYRWDTPMELAKNGQNEKLNQLMDKIYIGNREIKYRIKQIKKARRNEAEDQ